MIALVLAMLWNRRGQAVTLALLAMAGVCAAVAAPAYLRAADRAVAAGQVAAAVSAERALTIRENRRDHRTDDPADAAANPEPNLAETGGLLMRLPKFDYVYAVEYPAVGIEPDNRYRTRFVYRQDACEHLTITAGRCLAGESEIVLGTQTARRLKTAVGDSISLSFAVFNAAPDRQDYGANGTAKSFLVVGAYSVPEPAGAYWGSHDYFGPDTGNRPGEPVFVNAASLRAMDRGGTHLSLDGYPGPGALDVDALPAVRAGLAATIAQAEEQGPPIEWETGIPALLDRIDAGRAAAHLIVPVLAVALVLLACATIFLAVGYGTEGRRPELAVVALRGARLGQRVWLATGENLLAIVAGTVLGGLAGQLLVNAYAAVRFPGVGSDPGAASLRYAAPAALAAVLTALLAERRHLLSPVTELLRRAPRVPGDAAAVAATAAVALLAVVAGGQLKVSGGTLTGVGTFAAALMVAALSQLAARALPPVVTLLAGRALRRGRLGLALAGFQLSRRPGAARLFAVLCAAVAVAGYAGCAIDVAAQGRRIEAELGTGAGQVVTVAAVGREQLLTAVRKADPERAFAMAAVRLPTGSTEPPGLAVDTTRLGVAYWPGGGPDAAAVARALRPAAPAPPTVGGADLALDITATGLTADRPVTLALIVTSTAGLGDAVVPLGDVRAGRHTYLNETELCRSGCRINAVQVFESPGVLDAAGQLVLHAINPPGTPAVQLDPAHWRASDGGTLAAAPDGLLINATALNGLDSGLLVRPADTPYPLPVVSAGLGSLPTVVGLDGHDLPTATAYRLPAIPGAGSPATMVDLEYADRLSIDASPTGRAEVWLSPAAPADAVARLRAQGLTITSQRSAALLLRQLDDQGPALALGFFGLMGCLAAALAAGALILAATVDRARRAEDLSVLRVQGLARPALRQAALWTYPALVAGAALTGVGIALLTWWLTGWALPLAGLDPPPVPLPGWPRPPAVAATGIAVLIVLSGAAYLAGRRTLRAVT